MASRRAHVVILGGGFGGLHAGKALRRVPVRVTLIDRANHHCFQPLLYQVATAGLSAIDIGEPIRRILSRQGNVTVLMAEAERVDVDRRRVILAGEEPISYDFLNQQQVLQAVEALADALVDSGTLNYREATAVIDEAVLDRSRVAAFAERLQSK